VSRAARAGRSGRGAATAGPSMSRPSVHSPRTVPILLASSLALLVALGAGCSSPQPKPAAPARAQALIDSGNVRFRAGDYAGAAKRYGAAVAAAPDDPAAHYGLGMALAKLGRAEDARAEYGRARDLVQLQREPAADEPAP
jgi:Flp pilus assembly protein TadD